MTTTGRPIGLILFTLAVAAGVSAVAGAVTPDLQQALIDAGPDGRVPVVVMMEEFPALDDMLDDVQGLNRRDRRSHVLSTMKSLAQRSQSSVHRALAEESSSIRNVRVLWGVNGVALKATPAVIDKLATLPEVRWVMLDTSRGRPANGSPDIHLQLDDYVSGTPGAPLAVGPNPDATIRGEVIAMGAPQVWDELGYTGVGVIVAVLDTGVYPDHPDIADHIWSNPGEIAGNAIDDDNNGFVDDTWGWDFCNNDNDPYSGNHGTQVAGQVAGDGTNGVVTGMAPDAELMVVGFDCSPPDSIGWQASDYAIANGADIITESFIWPWREDTPDFEGWRRQTNTELAAGVVHVNAAGNDGDDPTLPVPYNVSAPANSPPPWLHPDQVLTGGLSSTITVGNISWSSDTIAPSSSIGPSAWEDIRIHTDPAYPHLLTPEFFDYPYENGVQMGLIKPDVSAYGNGTTTICPGTGYCGFSGTSSATPHVSGILALMLQSNAEATPAELTEALLTTAQHRGDPGKNNVYGTGLVQAFPAVLAVESSVLYLSHTVDDSVFGNGDLALDPGETVVMEITVESRTDSDVSGMVGILTSNTPGVTIHNGYIGYPVVPARGTASSSAPHFSLSIDPAACTSVVTFDFEARYEGKVRRSTFDVRIGDEQPLTLLADDFETDLGWSADPGTTSRGEWVREDPIGVFDGGTLSNPEDDTSDPGVTCWVTGNGSLGGQQGANNNDVDDGATTLTSPPFGEQHMLSLNLSYDRWYYDDAFGGDSFKTELSNDGGQNWTLIDQTVTPTGGWENRTIDLFAALPPTDDMRLRFVVTDGSDDTIVEGALDEVRIDGQWVDCQGYTPPAMLAPNAVGDTLRVEPHASGHTLLTWAAPAVDGTHDAATLYRIERATSPEGPFTEVGSATLTSWVDVDALIVTSPFYYRVRAENSGGSE